MFEDIFERNLQKQFLISYIKSPILHPLLIHGEKGVGKSHFALKIAQYINCTGDKTDSCKCLECSLPLEERGDILIYNLDKLSWGVGDIRELSERVSIRPLNFKYRSIIFNNTENLTSEGSDVFLSIVEDASPFNVFLFLTENISDVIPALRSRCWNMFIPHLTTSLIDYNGVPSDINEKNLKDRENSLFFIESFFTDSTLFSSLKYKDDTNILSMLKFSIGIFYQYFSNHASEHIETCLKSLESKKGREALLIIYNNIEKIIILNKQIKGINLWAHFFQMIIDIKLEIGRLR